jgi:hypothetical protein
MTRADIRKILKLADGLNPNNEDGLMLDEYYNIGIDEAVRQIAIDCNLIPVRRSMPLQANVYQYPIDEDVDIIRRVYYIDSNNQRIPLDYVSPEQWMDWEDMDDTEDEPEYYCYPMFMNEVIPFYSESSPVYDYILNSYVTEQAIRTLVDSGANFGRTLNNRKIEPGFIVHNLADGSYGYVQVLSITTTKVSGTASSGTNTTQLEDTTKDFTLLDIREGDIICTPSPSLCTSYAFVESVTATKIKYSDMQGAKKRFGNLDTYAIGRATEIRLSLAVPHPGLRNGSYNYFKVTDGAVNFNTLNIGGVVDTVFTATRVTGTMVGTPTTAMVAIASGGGHGKITVVGANYVDVDMWVGGTPASGESVSCKTCDKYQIEDNSSSVRAIWIGPTPSTSDANGTNSIEIMYNKVPELPQDDTDKLQIPDHYKTLLIDCARWQTALLSGKYDLANINNFRMVYKANLPEYAKDVNRPPYGKTLTMWNNRNGRSGRSRKYTTASGNRWDLSEFE